MKCWNNYLNLILNKYKNESDDFVISIGHWKDIPYMDDGVSEFRLYLRMTLGELRELER